MNSRPLRNRRCFRSLRLPAGFTLIELLISIVTFAFLMTGLVSVLLISTSTLKLTDGVSAKTSAGMRLLSQINGELVFAKQVLSRTPTSVEFKTADRDGDSLDEVIRIEYVGAPDNKVTKSTYYTLSGKTVLETLASDVSGFNFEYHTNSTPIESAAQERTGIEKLLFARDMALDELAGGTDTDSDSPTDSPGTSPSMGPVSVQPNVGKTTLLIVSDSTGLTTHESVLKNKLESLGVVVRIIEAGASQSEFDTETGLCDLIYIPFSIDSSVLGSKVRECPLGIITESVNVAEVLGLGKASTESVSGPYVNCRHDATPLVAGEVAGAIRIFGAQSDFKTLEEGAETLSPHLKIVASDDQAVTMAYLEKGDQAYLTEHGPTDLFGYTEEFSYVGDPLGWHHVGTRATLTEPILANSISVFNDRDSTSVLRFGIYTDNGGKPGTLLGETYYRTRSSTSSGSWTTSGLKEPLLLEPGEYWIMASVYGSVRFHYKSGGATRVCYSEQSVYSGMMHDWGSSEAGYGVTLSMYVTGNVAGHAEGRRVLVPWSGTGTNLNDLSEQGASFFSTSLQWIVTEKNESDESHHEIQNNHWVSQYFLPTLEPTESKWSLSRTSIYLQPLHSDQAGNLQVSLYLAGADRNPVGSPLSTSGWIPIESLEGDHFRWWTVPLTEWPVFDASQGVCLVIETDAATAGVKLGVDRNTAVDNAELSVSSDTGSTWNSSASSENMRIYVFGKTVSIE